MTTSTIIAEVVKIILKHAKPSRIYLYGSRNGGEAMETSDIDIAYEDPGFRDFEAIESDIEGLNTLVKIDVKNLAFSEERFRSRVRSTGRVLYSADKKLRFEDALYNLKRSMERLESAMSSRETLFEEGFSEFYLDIIVKRFEFTYEMSWKSIKRYLAFNGIDSKSPRSCFKEAYAMEIIADESVWLSMIEDRNLTSHIYSEEEAQGILERIDGYVAAFGGLVKELNARLEREG
jgi:nucleotidyltransferase substrate binding protein (TIGR01987 family)